MPDESPLFHFWMSPSAFTLLAPFCKWELIQRGYSLIQEGTEVKQAKEPRSSTSPCATGPHDAFLVRAVWESDWKEPQWRPGMGAGSVATGDDCVLALHRNIITIAVFYALPVVQLVITYQTVSVFICTLSLAICFSFLNASWGHVLPR